MRNKIIYISISILAAILISIYIYNKYYHIDYSNYDVVSDNSLFKFVGSDNSYTEKQYKPNLIIIENTKYYYFRNKNKKIELSVMAGNDFIKLGEAFYKEFGTPLVVASAYRSYDYQKQVLSNNKGCRPTLCAKPGYSEHQSGLAIDIFDMTDNDTYLNNVIYRKYYEWFSENAHKYGFHNSYQKGADIDGYEKEPWHWRYVGIELATKLKNNNITFTEMNKKILH